ncbi:hypothetical protein ACHAW5_003622 [Stephanodiscus triporus]|uniref:PPIase cyclophilin-type domain-containing protein n=1 Tax=Stephanodiscus triporus TaxID=2934178 RepID=A0ABD3PB42_9STRA
MSSSCSSGGGSIGNNSDSSIGSSNGSSIDSSIGRSIDSNVDLGGSTGSSGEVAKERQRRQWWRQRMQKRWQKQRPCPGNNKTRREMAPSKKASSSSFLASALLAATCLLLLLLLLLPRESSGFAHPSSSSSSSSSSRHRPAAASSSRVASDDRGDHRHQDDHDDAAASTSTRRGFLASSASSLAATLVLGPSSSSRASDGAGEEAGVATTTTTTTTTKSTADAVVTDRIFVEFKGLSSSSSPPGDVGNANDAVVVDRIVIGLFGNDSPQPVSVLKGLVTTSGYPSRCKPLDDDRTLEKERLEARKVYNSCLETENTRGVNYDYSTVWRVIKDERIDLGAVSGKFVARESPNFVDGPGNARMRHDAPGVVSVRRGDGGGFGFTIYPGGGDDASSASSLDEDNIVVGRVLEGMDVVKKLNDVTVVRSAGAMLSSGGRELKGMPSRGCRYGGSEYFCNENKPLRKVLLDKTGVL